MSFGLVITLLTKEVTTFIFNNLKVSLRRPRNLVNKSLKPNIRAL
jgi:hypothetical protein